MGFKYNPHRSRNIYDPKSDKPFKISRSKIDRFVECPRCLFIDRRLGTDRPPGFPFDADIGNSNQRDYENFIKLTGGKDLGQSGNLSTHELMLDGKRLLCVYESIEW